MDDAFGVRGIQAFSDLPRNVERVLERQRTLGNAILQRLAFEEGHREEGLAFGFADLVDRADVGL